MELSLGKASRLLLGELGGWKRGPGGERGDDPALGAVWGPRGPGQARRA